MQQRVNRERLKSKRVRSYVHEKLQIGWTPELIAGWVRRQDEMPAVCHEAIYQSIDTVAPHLLRSLPRHHSKRNPKRPYRKTRERIPNRVGLEARPRAATARRVCGHWEADTLVAGHRTHGWNGLVDRKSRVTHLRFLANKSAATTQAAILRKLKRYPAPLKPTIPYDNGSENVLHDEINAALGTQPYFGAPYHSWEKGSVEHINGLIRRFWPKGSNFRELGHTAIHRREQLLNHRPRKGLHYRTPYEVVREARGALHR